MISEKLEIIHCVLVAYSDAGFLNSAVGSNKINSWISHLFPRSVSRSVTPPNNSSSSNNNTQPKCEMSNVQMLYLNEILKQNLKK